VFAFANVIHLFADELSRLGAGGLSFALVFFRAFQCLFVGHQSSFDMDAPEWTP